MAKETPFDRARDFVEEKIEQTKEVLGESFDGVRLRQPRFRVVSVVTSAQEAVVCFERHERSVHPPYPIVISIARATTPVLATSAKPSGAKAQSAA